MDPHRRAYGLSDDENNLQPRVSRSNSPMTSPLEASLTVTLSREMEVLYDPLEAPESGTRQNEAITEYDLPSPFFPGIYGCSFFSIIAVHGLGSTPNRAWVHKESGKTWLKDFLPDDLNHKARVMTYNHQSHWESYAFLKSFDAFAQDLLRALEERRSLEVVCRI